MSVSTSETPKSNRSTKLWLIVFMVLSALLFVFGYLQKLEADKQAAIAIINLEEAKKSEQEAERAKKLAVVAQAEAELQRKLAEEKIKEVNLLLYECRRSN